MEGSSFVQRGIDMKKLLALALLTVLTVPLAPAKSYAVSEAECAIWLCLPGGFPESCEPAYSAFKSRIRSGKPPLPPISACGSAGSTSNYKTGYEPFEPCKSGYRQIGSGMNGTRDSEPARCQEIDCTSGGRWVNPRLNSPVCDTYPAVRKPKPWFIQLWMDGDYIGKFYYR